VRQRLLPFVLASVALLVLACGPLVASAAQAGNCRPGQTPSIGEGFRSLVDAVGDAVGTAVECEHPDATGDVQQQTTGGLLYWRKNTNTPTFTDGVQHWALQDGELVTWVGASVDPPGILVAHTTPAPTAPPTAQALATVPSTTGQVVRQTQEPPPVFSVPPTGLWAYVILSLFVFLGNLRSGRLPYTIIWFLFTTAALSVLLYGSAYLTTWDPDSQWLLPIKISNGADSPQDIPKTSLDYWLWTSATIGVFVTFPQAVLNTMASVLPSGPLDGRIKVIFVRLAQLFGIGVGFVAVLFAFTSWLNPFRSVQWVLVLGTVASLILLLGNVFWLNVRSGVRRVVKAATASA
jgi:hypothetical protein